MNCGPKSVTDLSNILIPILWQDSARWACRSGCFCCWLCIQDRQEKSYIHFCVFNLESYGAERFLSYGNVNNALEWMKVVLSLGLKLLGKNDKNILN